MSHSHAPTSPTQTPMPAAAHEFPELVEYFTDIRDRVVAPFVETVPTPALTFGAFLVAMTERGALYAHQDPQLNNTWLVAYRMDYGGREVDVYCAHAVDFPDRPVHVAPAVASFGPLLPLAQVMPVTLRAAADLAEWADYPDTAASLRRQVAANLSTLRRHPIS